MKKLITLLCVLPTLAWAQTAGESLDAALQNLQDQIDNIQLIPGPQGPAGPTGAPGAAGADGLDGATGATGATGAQGPLGLTGAQGAPGADGATGAQGVAGADGADGADGATGPQGSIGLTGATGAQGIAGPAGADGATGPQGTAGFDGATGATGAQGIQGVAGADGATGATGATGAQGIQGIQGVAGADGAVGPPGPPGADGQDVGPHNHDGVYVPVPVNLPPVVQDDSATTVEDTPVIVAVLANDSDPEGDPLTAAVVSCTSGSYVNVTYTPAPSFTGVATCTLDVSDDQGNTSQSTLTVQVNAAPPSGDFVALCAQPGVVYCNDFDTTLSANGNTRPYDPVTAPHGIAVDNEVHKEGGGSMRLTIDTAQGYEVSGTVSFAIPSQTGTFYVAFETLFGDNWQTFVQSQVFGIIAGMKNIQLTPGSNSCDSAEIILGDQTKNGLLTGIPGMTYSCGGSRYDTQNDWQPGGTLGDCGDNQINNSRAAGRPIELDANLNPICHVFRDDVWHQVELRVVTGSGVKLWIDGVVVVDSTDQATAGPYGYLHIGLYMTGHNSDEMRGSYVFGDGLWRIWYDNLIVSQNCITSC